MTPHDTKRVLELVRGLVSIIRGKVNEYIEVYAKCYHRDLDKLVKASCSCHMSNASTNSPTLRTHISVNLFNI